MDRDGEIEGIERSDMLGESTLESARLVSKCVFFCVVSGEFILRDGRTEITYRTPMTTGEGAGDIIMW